MKIDRNFRLWDVFDPARAIWDGLVSRSPRRAGASPVYPDLDSRPSGTSPMDGFGFLLFVCALIAVIVKFRRWQRAKERYEARLAAEGRARRAAEAKRLLERYNQLQRVVMACAKKEKGIVTPAAMVATARAIDRVTLDVAQRQLDYMVQKGDLELHASASRPLHDRRHRSKAPRTSRRRDPLHGNRRASSVRVGSPACAAVRG